MQSKLRKCTTSTGIRRPSCKKTQLSSTLGKDDLEGTALKRDTRSDRCSRSNLLSYLNWSHSCYCMIWIQVHKASSLLRESPGRYRSHKGHSFTIFHWCRHLRLWELILGQLESTKQLLMLKRKSFVLFGLSFAQINLKCYFNRKMRSIY